MEKLCCLCSETKISEITCLNCYREFCAPCAESMKLLIYTAASCPLCQNKNNYHERTDGGTGVHLDSTINTGAYFIKGGDYPNIDEDEITIFFRELREELIASGAIIEVCINGETHYTAGENTYLLRKEGEPSGSGKEGAGTTTY